MRDIETIYEVPVQKLMCSDVRMASLLTEPRPIHRKEMPVARRLFQLIYTYMVNQMAS